MKHQKLVTTPEVSKRMSSIKLKGSDAETTFAKALWHKGYRYRKNYKRLPGSPDIAILRYRIAIFIDGEFWHGKDWEKNKEKIKNNKNYWIEKIEENILRDKRNDILLKELGWIAIHYWEKEVKSDLCSCMSRIDLLTMKCNDEK